MRDQSRSRTHNFDGNTRPERCKFLFQNPIHTGRCDFHELRRKIPTETREEFYARILQVMAQMGGGSANVL